MDVAIPQPVVWSRPIKDPSAWRAAEVARDFSWIVTWSDADLTELEAALRHARRFGMTAETVTRDGFPLPTLSPHSMPRSGPRSTCCSTGSTGSTSTGR